jgi:hypothetical protein
MEAAMKAHHLSAASLAVLLVSTMPSLADSRTEKYRSNGCEIERRFDSNGKSETKVDCKPRLDRVRGGSGKEEFRYGGCEIKREWKEDGEYKEEVKCR